MTDRFKLIGAWIRRGLTRALPSLFVRVGRDDVQSASTTLRQATEADQHAAREAVAQARAKHQARQPPSEEERN